MVGMKSLSASVRTVNIGFYTCRLCSSLCNAETTSFPMSHQEKGRAVTGLCFVVACLVSVVGCTGWCCWNWGAFLGGAEGWVPVVPGLEEGPGTASVW